MSRFSTIVLTRPLKQSKLLAAKLEALACQTLVLPSIAIEHVTVTGKEAQLITNISQGRYNWVVLVSSNAAENLAQAMRENLGHSKIPQSTKLAAQGEKTAAIVKQAFGRAPEVIPAEFTAEGLCKELAEHGLTGARVMIPIGSKSRGVVTEFLRGEGALVDELIVYNNLELSTFGPELDPFLALDPTQTLVTFFSPSAVEGFLARIAGRDELKQKLSYASVGPTTSDALRAQGLTPLVEASPHSEEGLIQAISSL